MLTDTAIEILNKRYARKDENGKPLEAPSDIFHRVAGNITSCEEDKTKWANIFYNMMNSLDFLPNSPTLMNAGNKLQMLSACFTMRVRDSMNDILQAVKDVGVISSTGGGVGIDFSMLRPKDDFIKTTEGTSSGPVSFMKLFDATAEVIKQGGKRRSALLGLMRVDHPDIEEFIKCKEAEGKFSNFNISVAITDEFMDAVQGNSDFNLINPAGGKVSKTVKAKELWNLICESAHKNGEPGLVFIDTMNKNNPAAQFGEIESVNPCFSGDMRLLTENGYKSFKELDGKEVNVINRFGEPCKAKVFKTGTKKLVEVRLQNKEFNKILCTEDHKFMLQDGNDCIAKNLYSKRLFPFIKSIEAINSGDFLNKEYVKLGFIQGDGNLSRLNSTIHHGLEVNIGNKDNDVLELFELNKSDGQPSKPHSYYVSEQYNKLIDLKFSREPLPTRIFPETYNDWNIVDKASFLRGCFSANGCVIKRSRLGYKATSKQFIEQLAETLYTDFGIKPYVTTNKSTIIKFKNGVYKCKESYDLNIVNYNSILNFYNNIGFVQSYKNGDLVSLILKRAPYVSSVVETNRMEDVYDFTLDNDDHWGVVEGFVVHNCGESPLRSMESCNLGSINLGNFVKYKGSYITEVDYDKLEETVKNAVRFLDNVITMNKFPLKEIEEKTLESRKIGLGVMGFADMLAKLGVRYDSDMGLLTATNVMKFINNTAWETSKELAKERGAVMNEYRNGTVTSLAPTGTISMIANCSSGIEPFFNVVYKKNVMNKSFVMVNPVFKQIAEERGFYSAELMDKIAGKLSIQDIEEIPKDVREVFRTAQDISPEWHVKMQAAFQKHTSLGCSKTCNLPNSATIDDVRRAYDLAYQLGCKGITVYRDGSRSVQVIDTVKDNKKNEVGIDKLEPRHRPYETVGSTYKMQTGCGKLYITVNKDDRGLCEMFARIGKSGGCINSLTEVIGRLVSIALRAGVDVKSIVKQFSGVRCPEPCFGNGCQILSCADAIGKALTEFANKVNHEEIKVRRDYGNPECPECGSMLVMESGCASCKSCGYSRCS